MKKLIKCLIFLIIFCILWQIIFNLLWIKKEHFAYTAYTEPKNSLDIIYTGASNFYMHFNTVLAYDLYGFTTGSFSAGAQPFPIIKYILEETKKYQEPSLYIIDISRVSFDFKEEFTDAVIRRSTDNLKFSKNRIDAINDLLSYTDTDKSDYINYYFSFFVYHNRWKDITSMDFLGNPDQYKGYIFGDTQAKIASKKPDDWTIDALELPEENEAALLDLLDYIKSNDINVLFVIPTKKYDATSIGRLKDAISIVEDEGFNIINFNTLDDFKIDFSKELYNNTHLNVYGATKYTLYLSKYLNEHYDLPNHKGDPNYSTWDSEYKRFKESFKEKTKKDFENLLTDYLNPD